MARPSLDSFVGSAKPDLSSFSAAQPTPAAPQPQSSPNDFLTKASDAISTVFPGKQIGAAIGGSAEAIWQSIAQRSLDPIRQQAAENNANFGKIAGDVASVVATPASMIVGGPEGAGAAKVAARIGTNAAIGGGLGAASAASNGSDILQGAGTGAALGGAGSAAGEALNSLTSFLPTRLVNKALPKVKTGNEQYALENTKVGSIASLLQDSNASSDHLNGQIQTILTHPDYSGVVGDGAKVMDDTLAAFPDSALQSTEDVAAAAKSVAPEKAQLVDKVLKGEADLAQQNELRVALDKNTYKNHLDLPQLSFNKSVAHELANNLRANVQNTAPETAPIFDKWSKEINLNKALTAASTKLKTQSALGLYDIVALLGGLTTAGPVGAAGAVAAEKVLRSPAANLAAAHALNAVNKAQPAISAVVRAARPAIIKAVSGVQK